MNKQSPSFQMESAAAEIREALKAIQLLLPEEEAHTRDQQTLQAVGYIVTTMHRYVNDIQAAIGKLSDQPQ